MCLCWPARPRRARKLYSPARSPRCVKRARRRRRLQASGGRGGEAGARCSASNKGAPRTRRRASRGLRELLVECRRGRASGPAQCSTSRRRQRVPRRHHDAMQCKDMMGGRDFVCHSREQKDRVRLMLFSARRPGRAPAGCNARAGGGGAAGAGMGPCGGKKWRCLLYCLPYWNMRHRPRLPACLPAGGAVRSGRRGRPWPRTPEGCWRPPTCAPPSRGARAAATPGSGSPGPGCPPRWRP